MPRETSKTTTPDGLDKYDLCGSNRPENLEDHERRLTDLYTSAEGPAGAGASRGVATEQPPIPRQNAGPGMAGA